MIKKLFCMLLVLSFGFTDGFSDGMKALESGNSKKAFSLFEKACDKGNGLGCYNLGLMYANGNGAKQDIFKAAKLFQKACDHGSPEACYSLGSMHDYAQGVKQDSFEAVRLYKKACDGGNAGGCSSLGNIYFESSKKNYTDGFEFFKKSCNGGGSDGCLMAGIMYYEGIGSKQSNENALKYLKLSCEMKDEKGCQAYNKLKLILKK